MSAPLRALSHAVLLVVVPLSAGGVASAQQPMLPPGYVAAPVGNGWQQPVGLTFLDGSRMLVAERAGQVWLVEDDHKRNVVVDIGAEVLTNGDRGLLGIAVDPQFAVNGWIYLLYVVDPTGGGANDAHAFSRLVRYEAHFDPQGELHALEGSRHVVLGEEWQSGIPSCHLSHSIGTMRFLSDGSLVLSAGDGAHYDLTDAGGFDPDCFGDGRFSPDQDLGAYRSQYLGSYAGKILRIDPESGLGLADNPFFTGDPADIQSRVYALGLRNPFRFTLLPDSGPREMLFISDVGWNRWEEIDVACGGENFGWPCYEGRRQQQQYQDLDPFDFCTSAGPAHVLPLIAWGHIAPGMAGFTGNCATGIAFYPGGAYPPVYHGRLFFFDFGRGWLRSGVLGDGGELEDVRRFGRDMGGPVDLEVDPVTGDLVYAALAPPRIARLLYVGANLPPVAVAQATPAWGPAPLDVTLSALGSSDPDGSMLSYEWDLGDGETSTLGELVHTYPDPTITYHVRLTVTDPEGNSADDELVVTPGNTPPVVQIVKPAAGDLYTSGEPLFVEGLAADAEDGPTVQPSWTLDLIHDHHTHPGWATAEGLNAVLMPDSHGAGDNHFRLTLSMTDSRGLTAAETIDVFDDDSLPLPHLVDLPDDTPRVGQLLAPTGHIDFSRGDVDGRLPDLLWDWGDGTTDLFTGVGNHEDTTPTHVYSQPATYRMRLVTVLDDIQTAETVMLDVGPPRPAVAVFAPVLVEGFVRFEEQQEVVAALVAGAHPSVDHVASFQLGEGADLARWMEAFLDDGVVDVVVLVDFVPEPLFAGEPNGSLAERWLESGNGIVWTGQTPFAEALTDDGQMISTGPGSLGAERVLDASPGVCLVEGQQTPTALAAAELPSLAPFYSPQALRPSLLGMEWSVRKLYAQDEEGDSDAIVIGHASGGFFAQVLCSAAGGLPRPAVVRELLDANLVVRFRRPTQGSSTGPR